MYIYSRAIYIQQKLVYILYSRYLAQKVSAAPSPCRRPKHLEPGKPKDQCDLFLHMAMKHGYKLERFPGIYG